MCRPAQQNKEPEVRYHTVKLFDKNGAVISRVTIATLPVGDGWYRYGWAVQSRRDPHMKWKGQFKALDRLTVNDEQVHVGDGVTVAYALRKMIPTVLRHIGVVRKADLVY